MMVRRNVKARAVTKTALKPVEEVKKSAEKSADKKSAYSKTEINRMSTADLKELAKSEGIDSELSGADIKKALINKFEL